MTEYWDIYDADKKPTGRLMKRNDWRLKEGEYHLSVLGVLTSPRGEFLITKRKMDKHWAPGWWEVPGGAVKAGETSFEAVCREVREETGLEVSGVKGGFVFSYHRDNPGEGDNYFVDVYRFVLELRAEEIRLQEEEAEDWQIADLKRIEAYAREGIFLHYDSIRRVLEMK